MTPVAAVALIVLGVLLTTSAPGEARAINVGPYSQQVNAGHARIGASVQAAYRSPGRAASSRASSPPHVSFTSSPPAIGGAVVNVGAVPTLPSGAPILRDSTPLGAGSFWMNVNGQRCAYSPTSNGACFNVAPGGGAPGAPPVDPRALAEAAAQRLALLPGRIVASPSRRAAGLTGAPSWFWLEPAPGGEALTVALGAERVTVTAVPSTVMWSFGDGGQRDGGPGRPYRSRAGGQGSIQHRYQTRCLPGDQGHDPYVLATCTPAGYQVGASVQWTISFQAAGPVATAGGLAPRTTATGIAYPVDEVRGFLARDVSR